MSYPTKKLNDISIIRTGKLDSNAAVENGIYPFFTCDPQTLTINTWAYDTEAVLLAGNNASGNYTAKYFKGKFNAYQRTYIIESADCNLINVRFLCYAMNLQLQLLKAMSSGSTTKFLTIRMLNDLNIPCPKIETQKKIADILSAYDDLIENNQKQIKLLEEAAQRLYKEWFIDLHFPGHESTPIIDGIPQGWEMGTLGEIALFKRGKTITKDQTIYGNIPVVAGGLEPAYYHNQANTVAPVITVSGSGANAGFTRLYSVNVWASDCSYVDSQVTNNIYFVYCCLKDKTAELDALQKGAAQPHVYAKDINVIKLLIPNNDLLKQYNEIVECIFKKIKVLEAQNLQLKEARDRLLPKLMNGEIKVGIDKQETAKKDNFDYIRQHWRDTPYNKDLPLAARSTGDISEETLEKLKEIAEEE